MSADMWQFEHSLALPFFGFGMKNNLASPVAIAEFSKFAGMLSATLSQHHLSGFETAQQVGFPGDSEVKASAWDVGDP